MSKYTCGDCPWHHLDSDDWGWCSAHELSTRPDCVECPMRRAFRVVRDAVRFLNAENKHEHDSAVASLQDGGKR